MTEDILRGLRDEDRADVSVICGGIIPARDVAPMMALGVKGVYGPGTPMETIIADIHQLLVGIDETAVRGVEPGLGDRPHRPRGGMKVAKPDRHRGAVQYLAYRHSLL